MKRKNITALQCELHGYEDEVGFLGKIRGDARVSDNES